LGLGAGQSTRLCLSGPQKAIYFSSDEIFAVILKKDTFEVRMKITHVSR